MEMLKSGRFAAVMLAVAVAVGCSSKGGDQSGQSTAGSTGNEGYGANTGGVNGGADQDAALRAVTTFYFDYDSYNLKPEALRSLDVHARDLKSEGSHVALEGHTDERGTPEYNIALGEKRAKAVQRYLVLQGVSPSQLEVISYGEERPAAIGHSEEAWAQNRRVELRK